MTKGPKTRIGAWLARPLWRRFHLVVTIATMLTVLGLVMVLSASSVEQYVSGWLGIFVVHPAADFRDSRSCALLRRAADPG